ncbi:MAG: hypothetical protein K8R87_03430 [Verrucomicrobia bacterium]|nr:hypothetical protein [Verrucomicrobiota bacterium]
MNLDRLTQKLQEGLASAQSQAAQYGHPEIKPSHVLLALIDQEGGVTKPLLEKIGSGVDSLKATIESHLARQPKVSGGGQPQFSHDLRETLTNAEKEQKKLKDDYLSVEHFILALLKTRTDISSRHAGAQSAHQEQPGAHRGARGGQNGHRRGARATHHSRRRARLFKEQEADQHGSGGDDGWCKIPR